MHRSEERAHLKGGNEESNICDWQTGEVAPSRSLFKSAGFLNT